MAISIIFKPYYQFFFIWIPSVVIQITEISGQHVYGRVIEGGKIGTNKGISLDREIKIPPLKTESNKKYRRKIWLLISLLYINNYYKYKEVKWNIL